MLPALGKWSHVSILLTDGDIVRCGIWQAKAQVPLRVRFKCIINTTPTLAQVEKFTCTTNCRRQKESGRRNCLNTRGNVFNGPNEEVLCSSVSVQEIVWVCLIQAILPTLFWPGALGIQEYPLNSRLAHQPNISHFITAWKCCTKSCSCIHGRSEQWRGWNSKPTPGPWLKILNNLWLGCKGQEQGAVTPGVRLDQADGRSA